MRRIITKATLVAASVATVVAIGVNTRAVPAIAGGNTATATATATATVVEPLTIQKQNNLSFGSFSINGAGSISSEGVTDNTTLVPNQNNTNTNARFTVRGTPGYSYNVTIPTRTITVIDDSDTEIDVSGPDFGRTLNGGIDELAITGILNVDGNENPGSYTSSNFNITVNYE